ncbi:hypothetical protein [Methylobacterium brachiatum]|uniref:hypothetical protein n=1 Tax=Methylobacterium brachiatum TaxID=269660 RepID=UPI00040714ED|nr:hypothetical protein [Methylobacterium brachiatum]SFI80207.1 hypothetical protein SAMN02799642_02819 [Methylobacterium brachiatum]
MHVMDTKSWTSDQCKEFVREANETVEDVKATGEPWDAYIRRVSPEYDLIQVVWPDKRGRGGCSFGVVKGLGLLMLIGQGTKPVTLRKLRFRLRDYDTAYMTWAMYGDGRSKHPDAVELVDAAARGAPRSA